MKIKTILAFVFLCSSFQTVKGQTNNIYMELLGVGGMGSINYERMIIKDKLFAAGNEIWHEAGIGIVDAESDDAIFVNSGLCDDVV